MSGLDLNVRKLNEMIQKQQILEAFDRYYAPGVVMVESGGEPVAGYEANRARESVFAGGLKRWDAKLISSAVDEQNGTALNEWVIDFEHVDFGLGTLRQVARQQWRDGRIVHEAFYKL